MATKQDQTKKILKKLSKEEIGRITLELSKIPLFKASEAVILTEEHRAVMVKQISEKYFPNSVIYKLNIIH